eukprot:TRINITY_DN4733_c0_g1_i6.p1 TRINITY_DN4733_c0_g1~~TRINITY_DN4733_c0_g1_i6.p1  ORF type:complete len:560 (+),score=4.66 TRINITY_DN4733_c0_g1_i6:3584-5263(+)
MIFFNYDFDKSRLKSLLSWCFLTFGEKKTMQLADNLKNLGFYYATKAGISIGLDDLLIPPAKQKIILNSEKISQRIFISWLTSEMTSIEQFQQIIDIWHRTSDLVKQQVIQFFKTSNQLNPIYIMAFSGARGNISQVRQLVGMRGLMADPQGRIINFPIQSNFKEGLTLTEYLISCYGARKGLVDTALRTATSGYLTRRLVDVAQQIVVSQFDCTTNRGINIRNIFFGTKKILSLQNRILGRVLAENIFIKKKIESPSPFFNGCQKKCTIHVKSNTNRKNITQRHLIPFSKKNFYTFGINDICQIKIFHLCLKKWNFYFYFDSQLKFLELLACNNTKILMDSKNINLKFFQSIYIFKIPNSLKQKLFLKRIAFPKQFLTYKKKAFLFETTSFSLFLKRKKHNTINIFFKNHFFLQINTQKQNQFSFKKNVQTFSPKTNVNFYRDEFNSAFTTIIKPIFNSNLQNSLKILIKTNLFCLLISKENANFVSSSFPFQKKIQFFRRQNKSFEKDLIKILGFRNQEINSLLAFQISNISNQIFIRSPLTCELRNSVCQLCYGWV